MEQDMKVIRVEMLGGFSMAAEDRQIDLGSNGKANFLKLIEIVLLNLEHGIAKRELIDGVFGYKELLDENNSLNNLLHQARQQLKKGGFPGSKYIIGKKGLYTAEKPEGYTYEIDAFRFKELYFRGSRAEKREEKVRLYEEALQLYKGELLPDFATDYWVILESVQLKRFFDDIVAFLGAEYRSTGAYEQLYRMYETAGRIYPESGWQIEMIDALILRKEYKAAYELYGKTAKHYLEDLEVPLPDRLLECYDGLHDEVKVVSNNVEEIQASIIERDSALKLQTEGDRMGSYYCAFTSFIDVYHVLRRNMLRRGSSIFMMLCTLVDYEGKLIQNSEKLETRSQALKTALEQVLRQGDVFTKYSASQYLILLIGARKEDCGTIYYRISGRLKELAGSRADFQYRIVSLAEIPALLDQGKLR